MKKRTAALLKKRNKKASDQKASELSESDCCVLQQEELILCAQRLCDVMLSKNPADPQKFKGKQPKAKRVGKVYKLIRENKTRGRRPEEFLAGTEFRLAFERYQNMLVEAASCDFDDLIGYAAQLLEKHPTLATYSPIFVDEFQDTNQVQMEVLLRLLGQSRALTAVGDDDQQSTCDVCSCLLPGLFASRKFEECFRGSGLSMPVAKQNTRKRPTKAVQHLNARTCDVCAGCGTRERFYCT